jgi:DnaJ-class molecular chaperone
VRDFLSHKNRIGRNLSKFSLRLFRGSPHILREATFWDMDYYEELGLTRSASPEEIQESYRSLVNVLHPDRQQREEVRVIAECQMRRLNEMVATLKDPAARFRYDASLAAKTSPRSSTPRAIVQEALSTRIIWCFCLLIGFGGIFSYLRDDLSHTRMIESSARSPVCTEASALQARVQQLEQELNLLRGRKRTRTGGSK